MYTIFLGKVILGGWEEFLHVHNALKRLPPPFLIPQCFGKIHPMLLGNRYSRFDLRSIIDIQITRKNYFEVKHNTTYIHCLET